VRTLSEKMAYQL